MAFAEWVLLLAAALPAVVLADDDFKPTPHQIASIAENERLIKYIFATWFSVVGFLLFYRCALGLIAHVRRIANLQRGSSADGCQRYFTIPDDRWAKLKRHFVLAPLFRKRHNREFQMSAAINVGTLPSRLQTTFLVGYFVMNVVLCAVNIDWTDKHTMLDDGVRRTGTLAVLNMLPLFLLAGRNNPLIWLLGISFDTYNMIHRWIGRIVVFEAVAHGAFWMVDQVVSSDTSHDGWAVVRASMAEPGGMAMTGTIAAAAFVVILLQAPSVVRHAFYETFLHIHIALAFTALVTVYMHLAGVGNYQSFPLAALIFWLFERLFRVWTLVRNNVGRGVTKAEVEALPGDAVRVTLRLVKPWKFRPGQHVYLYMPSVGLWTSHPFSLAWSQEVGDPTAAAAAVEDAEKPLPTTQHDCLPPAPTRTASVSLVIRRRTGFTDKLFRKAESSPQGRFVTTAFAEGPYGAQDLQSYGTVMLFAAGVGITHQVPHVRDLVAAYAAGTCATRRVVLVWIIQSPEHLEWIRPWMTEILGMDRRRDVLRVLLFVTRPRSTKEIRSPSSSVQMFPGRPDVAALVDREQRAQVGAMAVSVCGTGRLSDDVRLAVRERCLRTEVDFFEEAFSW